MGFVSNTGLLAIPQKPALVRQKSTVVDLRCDVTPAPFMLRPYAGLYNPFSHACSVLCNHPADLEAKEYVRRAKDSWLTDLSRTQDQNGFDKDKIRTPHDIVTEDMFRRYTETDSRPLTPAPTLASGKSRGSRRCLTPDQPHQRTAIVLDLRRSHSQSGTLGSHALSKLRKVVGLPAPALPHAQPPYPRTTKYCVGLKEEKETLYYHGYTTSEMTVGHNTSTNDRSTLPSLNLSEAAHARLIKGQCEQLPPLASPLVLSKRAPKEAMTNRSDRKNQLKALKIGKVIKSKGKSEAQAPPPPPTSQRSKGEKDKETNDGSESAHVNMDGSGDACEVRRRGKRYRKGRPTGSDRLTSAGLAAQTQQDPETQIAGIGSDSHNPSSRGSVAPVEDDVIILPVIKAGAPRKTDSFLDDEILKYLHREVDEEAIETEFDTKRRYVLEEALRTRPERTYGQEMQALLKELKVPAVSLGDWLHIPRVFSRRSAQFTLPIDSNSLETLMPMQYAARFVNVKKSKQLLYLTVLRKFKPGSYKMPIKVYEVESDQRVDIGEALMLMMGGILSAAQTEHFKTIMEWEGYVEEDIPDEIKLTLLDTGYRKRERLSSKDSDEPYESTLKYRTWCGLCAICERMYGRFPPRDKDPPDGMELSDFTMVETRLAVLKVHAGLIEILNTIRVR